MTNASQTDASALLAQLKHTGRRHAENLEGLRRISAHYQSEITRLDAEIDSLSETLAHVPPPTDPATVDATFQAKLRIVELERDRDTLRHEQGLLEPQIAETEGLIGDNTAAIEKLEAKVGL
jgi:chromosome segregation ATPase